MEELWLAYLVINYDLCFFWSSFRPVLFYIRKYLIWWYSMRKPLYLSRECNLNPPLIEWNHAPLRRNIPGIMAVMHHSFGSNWKWRPRHFLDFGQQRHPLSSFWPDLQYGIQVTFPLTQFKDDHFLMYFWAYLVLALAKMQALSTPSRKDWTTESSSATTTSVWPLPKSWMWSMAPYTFFTTWSNAEGVSELIN